MHFDERLKYLQCKYPDMPEAQARSVATFCDFGWQWEGFGYDGSVDISRPDTTETIEKAYIRTDGSFRYA